MPKLQIFNVPWKVPVFVIGAGHYPAMVLVFLLVSVGFTSTSLSQPGGLQDERAGAVGLVSLLLGKAYLFNDEGRLEIVQGMSVSAGDRIYTDNNGHVHIRFIDDALVSVRPRSTLEIERYDFDEINPEKSAVKFNLSEGVARSISGDAAKTARKRFRLNTPVAAIGVRGTDFVVSANTRATRALVYEGSIVMAPFSSACRSDGLGPCSQNAVELADDSFQVVELSSSNLLPRVEANQYPNQLSDLQDRFELSAQAPEEGARASRELDKSDGPSAFLEVAASDSVIKAGASRVDASSQGLSAQLPDFTPNSALSNDDVSDSQLVWGRFSEGKGARELLSVERLVASQERNVTIAAGDYLLYRTEPAGARVESNLGSVGFNLVSAQAFYNFPNGALPLRVDSGNLNLNFVEGSFSTALELDHDTTGSFNFSGIGRIADGGYLIGLDGSQSILGAVSVDGSEAGYFFDKPFGTGTVSGLTLWGGQ